jgi:uncharacterized small protein (DUF1192 family)
MAKPDGVHGADGKYVRTLESAERDAQACRLKARRMSYAKIAERLGYYDGREAYRGVQRALAAVVQEPAAELLQLELQQLDMLARQVLKVLERRHVTVSHGQLVYHDGKPLVDDGPVLQAVDRLLKIQERRAKLLGLDAPKRLEVVTIDWLDEQIRTLTAELERQLAEFGGGDPATAGDAEGAARP